VCKFKKIATGFGEYIPDFEKFIKKFIEDNKLSNMVFVNQVWNRADIHFMLSVEF
jgi:hypothetical protein